jgi:hypothetical protein
MCGVVAVLEQCGALNKIFLFFIQVFIFIQVYKKNKGRLG